MGHNHNHHHTHQHSAGGIGVAFFLNLSFMVVELAGGLLTNSIAIISDAVHDLGDSVSLAMAWYFQKLSKKGSSKTYSYGYKRFSLLGAIINAVVLFVGSAYVLMEAVPRLFAPQETDAKGMFVLAVLGIIVNGAAVLRMKKGKSINERVVTLHLLEDVLGWIAVLAGAAVIHFTGLTIIDPILSIGVACFVIFNAVRNIRRTLPIIMQGVPSTMEHTHIADEIGQIKGVANVHDLHIWSLNEEYNVLTTHITLAEPLSVEEQAALKAQIRALLDSRNIHHATIEFETAQEHCIFEKCTQTREK